jgi:hypothetical protein
MGLHLYGDNPPSRRLKRLDIQADMFLRALRGLDGKNRIRTEGLPEDIRCVGLSVDQVFNTVTLYLESPEWSEVPEGSHIEQLNVTFFSYIDGPD